ncbi:LOW QUALITY PROTEIN: protein SEMI-ROLLED LEAF 2-like [Prosopis cineraria]|uniref:LOW QUALITY PROTEIN: protein SEMI-ROLLED LEAF 2-like n=1 Tax=Prosopis cineraria TaxID=364024 RepID=UPI00241067D2|nr:LOW QUALITY PROTEIN: protein SEMI-ROLLED LEAF 2-like [Prosopis cineraria]
MTPPAAGVSMTLPAVGASNNGIRGVMSRRVVPGHGNLCFCCPSLRTRSRQPIKHYKKFHNLCMLLLNNQDAEPNDRKIGKLCEYAAENLLRIPKILDNLEQRCYKNLRNKNFGSVKVVWCIYRKMLSSCKGTCKPLFANDLLVIIQTLLEQTRTDGMRIIGLGEYEQPICLRSAALQALSCMVQFMGEHSHHSMDFDKMSIVFILSPFQPLTIYTNVDIKRCTEFGIFSQKFGSSDSLELLATIISVTFENVLNFPIEHNHAKEEKWHSQSLDQQILGHQNEDRLPSLPHTSRTDHSMLDTAKDPTYWSKVYLFNMAKLATEATTVWHVLEPLFYNFDAENYWSPEKGVAFYVLLHLKSLLAESGDNSHLLFSSLIKHLDHKNVAKQPILQIDVVNVTTQLAQNVKPPASIAIIGTISYLVKHLRKCQQSLIQSSNTENDACKRKANLQHALQMCILQLSSKAFPDALFHQLLQSMTHPDHERRVGAHGIFSVVLMLSLFSTQLNQKRMMPQNVKYESFSIEDASLIGGEPETKAMEGDNRKHAVDLYPGRSFTSALTDGKELSSIRLSSHRVSLLLSSIWIQAISMENGSANFEAMAHTYSTALLFTCSKTSNYMALVRYFQLAFSIRSFSLDQGSLQPSQMGSLFTLGTNMLIISARAGHFPDLVPVVKASMTETTAVCLESEKIAYGSLEDQVAATESLSAAELDDKKLKDIVTSNLMTKFANLSEDELFSLKKRVFYLMMHSQWELLCLWRHQGHTFLLLRLSFKISMWL